MTRCKGAAVWFGRLAVATTLLAVTSTSSSHRPPLSSSAAFAVLRPWDLLRNSGQASRIGSRCALSAARMRSGPVKGEVRNPWGRAGKPETRAVRQREAEDNAQLRAKAWRQAISKVRRVCKQGRVSFAFSAAFSRHTGRVSVSGCAPPARVWAGRTRVD
jgi:hypothetical protein